MTNLKLIDITTDKLLSDCAPLSRHLQTIYEILEDTRGIDQNTYVHIRNQLSEISKMLQRDCYVLPEPTIWTRLKLRINRFLASDLDDRCDILTIYLQMITTVYNDTTLTTNEHVALMVCLSNMRVTLSDAIVKIHKALE